MSKVYDYRAVGSFINDTFPKLSYDDYTLMRWCAYGAVAMNNENYLICKELVPVDIKNGLGELPCDVYRVRTALLCGEPIRYTTNSVFIRPNDIREGEIHVTYDAIPLNDEGLPVVYYNQIEPLAWNAIYKLYQQKFMDGDIGQAQFAHIDERYHTEYRKLLYNRSGMTDDDYEILQWIQRNVIWTPQR
jgi:hypothetical protein